MSTWDILNIRFYQIEFYVVDLFTWTKRNRLYLYSICQDVAMYDISVNSMKVTLPCVEISCNFCYVFLVQNNYAFWWYIWSVDVICQNCLWNYPLNWKSWPTTRHINSDIRLHGFLSHQLFKRVITIYPWRVNPCTHKGLHFKTKNQLRCFDTTHQLQDWSQKLDNFVAFQGTTEALRAGWLNLVS